MAFPDQLGFSFQAAARRIWTVHDLIGAVRTALEREYTDVWVEGEISNFRPAGSQSTKAEASCNFQPNTSSPRAQARCRSHSSNSRPSWPRKACSTPRA